MRLLRTTLLYRAKLIFITHGSVVYARLSFLVALSRLRFVFFAAFLCLACSQVFAQAASSDYTTDLPSVDRVKAVIKGSDPTDTLERQVAVFTYLSQYVERIKYNRTVRGPYTPGETRVITAYNQAAYQMSQNYAKSHTPDEAKAFERRHGQYEMDEAFNDDWQKRLIGPQTAAAYNGAVNSLAAGQKAHYNQEIEQNKKDTAAQQAGASGVSNDPTSATTRRCLELGGDSTACLGKGLTSGIISLFTGGAGAGLGDMMGSGRFGVVLSGNYHTSVAATGINFTSDSVGISRCGDLEEVGTPYTIHKSPAAVQIVLESKPRPIALSMRPDGSLLGPGLVDVTGQVIVGYHTVTTTQMINGARAAPNQCNGPYQTISRVPDYAPKTVRCNIASFAPPQPAPPASATPADTGIFGALTGMMGTGAPASEPGLRMTGKYSSSSGLLLDFGGDAVTLDCGQAHIKAPYTVENTPAQFVVHVQNGGGPFTLAVASDNTLRGSGSTAVNGRLVSGMNGDNVTFAPHSETCAVGTFAPKTGAPSTSIAANTPAATPSPNQPISTAVTPAASSVAPAGSTGMSLAITSSFPIAKNPLAGRVVQLMSERFDIALRKVGAPIPADTTPGQALKAYSGSCPPPTGCPAAAKLLHPYYVGHATFDGDGKATLTAPLPPGSYYVFCSAIGTSGALVWDLPITLKAGDNTIALTATNAELVH